MYSETAAGAAGGEASPQPAAAKAANADIDPNRRVATEAAARLN